MLARFLKPNWQHPKPEKRIKAIAKLREDNADDQAILAQLALKDQDETVRLSATEKLSGLNVLVQISQNQNSNNLQQLALHRISQILLANTETPSAEEKRSALAYITDNDLLTHIVLNSQESQLREQAILQIRDDSNLAMIAEKSPRAAVRVLAAEQINSESALEQLQKSARNKDKGVFKVTRDKLQIIREELKQQQAIAAEVSQVLSAIQQLSTGEFFPLFAAKLKALEAQWSELCPSATIEQLEAFQNAAKTCSARLNEHEAQRQAEVQQQARIEAKTAESHALYSELCILKENSSTLSANKEDVEAFQTSLDALNNHWPALKQYSNKTEQASFDKIVAQLKNLITAYFHLLEANSDIQALCLKLNEASTKADSLNSCVQQANQLISKFSWPKLQEKPASLVQLENALASAKKRLQAGNQHTQQLQDELNAVLDMLKEAISSGEIKSADKQIKKAEQLSKRLNGDLPHSLDMRIKTLGAELQEIRDWQAYAVAPKKESLCEEMEALSNCTLPPAERAIEIRRIQKEWKLLDATDSVHSQHLWKRFKKASDLAYAPCDKHFAEQKDLRKSNLEKRRTILAELQKLQAPEDSSNEAWKSYSQTIHQAKTDWRNHSPVDRAPGKKLQSEFDQLLKQLDAPLKEVRQENAQEKQNLIAETEQLLEANNLHDATERVKELQKQWKELGPAPRNQERKLWNHFRENCSKVFELYFANKDNQKQTTRSNAAELSRQCTELESLIEQGTGLDKLQQHLSSIQQLLPIEDNELSGRIEKAVVYVQRQKHELQKFEAEPYITIQRKAGICEELENAILDEAADTYLPKLQQAWQETSLNQIATPDVDQRFFVLLSLIENPDQMDEMISLQQQRLRHLCIRLEIATSQPSPSEDQALRMEYQMERIQQALAEQQQGFNLSEIKQLEQEWLTIPFASHFEEFNERFEARLQHFL